MSYEGTIAYLYSLQKYGMKFGLDNIRRLMDELGNPHTSFCSIHVAGTNGKGSTSAMIESLVRTSGVTTGLFTSPHLVSFTERIRVNGKEISEAEVVSLADEVQRVAEHIPGFLPTFFEVTTAIAFLYFRKMHVAWAVVEVGMGGRLDATNILMPEVSVITAIDIDHSDFLGSTLREIAGEKAGIIKQGMPVITALQHSDAAEVLKLRAEQCGSDLVSYGRLGLCLYFVFRYNTLLPVKLLSGGAERVARGDLSQDVAVYSHDELGQLTESFNAMMHRLKASVTEKDDALAQLRDLNRSLNARVAERTARLELAQKIAHMGHWDVPAEGSEMQVSVQVYSILGIDPGAALTTRALLRRVHPDDRAAVLRTFARGLDKPSALELEFRVRRPDGDERWLTLTADAGGDSTRGGPRLSGIVQDITERKRAELLSQAALTDKINAESANAAKSAFLATMSHEIRTPLTAILGFADVALDRQHPENQRADALHTIIRNGRHLLHVINEILDFSKIESKNLVIERLRTPLFQVIADVTSLMGMQAREKGLNFAVEYTYPLPTHVSTDPTRLKQILLNLCANAIKFTHQGSVRLELAYDPASQQLCLSVVDSGIGINTEQQAKLFQPFSQADSSTTRRFGGTGLGLYISKQLAEKLGGGISIQSISGLGTRMNVTIDAGTVADTDLCTEIPDATPPQVVAPPPGDARPLRGRVLLAEDSPDNQRLISLYVHKAGAEITIVDNGQRAVETALADNFDLVLMDMQMPVMDGITATEWLRKAGYAGPVVAITANALKEDQQRCLEAGCDGFLTKPIDTAAFHELLARYLAPAAARTDTDADDVFVTEMRALTAQFMDGLLARVQGMQQALDAADHEQLRRATHQLKGSAGTYGCPEITEQAAQLERHIKSNDQAGVHAALATLIALVDAALGRWHLQNTIDARAFDARTATGGARR